MTLPRWTNPSYRDRAFAELAPGVYQLVLGLKPGTYTARTLSTAAHYAEPGPVKKANAEGV